MSTRLDDLYERDFYAWTRQQAQALRRLAETRPNAPVDWEHLVEEVADLGKSERDAVRSHVRRIMLQPLKLQNAPASAPRGAWASSILESRAALEDKLTPTLRADARRNLARLYARARARAALELAEFGEREAAERLPTACPYALRDLLDEDWLPGRER